MEKPYSTISMSALGSDAPVLFMVTRPFEWFWGWFWGVVITTIDRRFTIYFYGIATGVAKSVELEVGGGVVIGGRDAPPL